MVIGNVYQEIRKNKKLTQEEVCQGEVTTASLSNFENGKVAPSYEMVRYFFDQINMTFDEFNFLCDLEEENEVSQIERAFRNIRSSVQVSDIEALINECEVYLEYESNKRVEEIKNISILLLEIQKNKFSGRAREFASKLWKTMESKKEWYLSELKLVSYILFIFSIDEVYDTVDRILDRLEEYEGYRDLMAFRAPLLVNLSSVYIRGGELDRGREILLLAQKDANSLMRYDYIAICQIRLGIIDQDKAMIKKGLKILEVMEDTALLEEFKKEVKELYKKCTKVAENQKK